MTGGGDHVHHSKRAICRRRQTGSHSQLREVKLLRRLCFLRPLVKRAHWNKATMLLERLAPGLRGRDSLGSGINRREPLRFAEVSCKEGDEVPMCQRRLPALPDAGPLCHRSDVVTRVGHLHVSQTAVHTEPLRYVLLSAASSVPQLAHSSDSRGSPGRRRRCSQCLGRGRAFTARKSINALEPCTLRRLPNLFD